jgi:hypothetical protein
MERVECSVWNNGGPGWGLRVLGGPKARRLHFDLAQEYVSVDLGGTCFRFNINKKSFWKRGCGELIGVPLRNWISQNDLNLVTEYGLRSYNSTALSKLR